MRKTLFLLLSFIIPCFLHGQEVEFTSFEKLELPGESGYFHPLLSPSGQMMALTSSNRQGLFVYNFESGKLQTISDAAGAGSKVVFAPDESKLYFTEESYVQNRRRSSLMVFNFGSGQKNKIENQQQINETELNWWKQWQAFLRTESFMNLSPSIEALKDGHYNYPYVVSKGNRIIYRNGLSDNPIQPFDTGNYLWASLSPDGTKIVGVSTGKGAFVCDSDGSNAKRLGDLESPVWLNNDFIAGMVTEDDGHVITNASLRVICIHDKSVYEPADTSLKIMHPSVCRENNRIAAHTDDGEIVLFKYRVSD